MKNYLFSIYFITISLLANSQTIDIIGSVADSTTKQALSYGNIIVKNKADSIIHGALTNESGDFKIKNISYQKGMYMLIKYMGYTDKRIEVNYTNSTKINLDKIFLQPDVTQIKEATIVGQTKYMEQKFDRKVFNINEAKTTSAKDIFDLLRTLPGVTVEQDNTVIYKGAPATIYVDDQPAEYVYPKTEMIPVANVLKIELIDASLRSGAGKGGIINIKMKNLATDGFSGVAQTENRSYSFKDLNKSKEYINANFKIKKIIFFNNLNYSHTNSFDSSKTNGSLNYNSGNYSLTNNASDKNIYDDLWDYGGVRYSPDTKTRLRLSGGFYKNNGVYPTTNNSQQNDNSNNSILEKYNLNTGCNFDNLSKWLNASFYHSFDSIGRELSVYCGLNKYSHDQIILNTYNYQYLAGATLDSAFNYETNGKLAQNGFYSGFYYNNPINAKTRWNCGWDGWFQYKGYENIIYSQNEIEYLPLTSYTKHKESDQTAYFRFGTTVKKWKFDAGISAEYDKNVIDFTRYTIDSHDTLLSVNKPYLNMLPSATIVYSPDSLQEIKFTYSKSVQTLWYNQLCDFIDKTNPFGWSVGNSKLKLAVYNNFYLGYAYNKETWNINTDIFYSITNNDISNLTIPVTDVITINMPENIAHNSSVGIELSSWVSINKKYDLNFSASVNHTEIRSSDLNGIGLKEKDYGYNFKFNADVHLSKKTIGTFYVNYFSRQIIFTGYNYDYFNSSFSLTHKFFENKFLVTLGVNDILDNLLKQGNYYNYAGFIQNTIQYSSSYIPTFFITLQYKFRQGDRGTKDSGKMGK
jgi:hypothetical protein